MFVFAFEGALLAFIVNGDRFVLLALLPRRKPRTDRTVQPPYHSLSKNSTSPPAGTTLPVCRLASGMDFSFNDVAPHLHTMRAKCRLGFTAKKIEAIPIAGDDLDFQIFCADRLAEVL
jgi:hypothetical protein